MKKFLSSNVLFLLAVGVALFGGFSCTGSSGGGAGGLTPLGVPNGIGPAGPTPGPGSPPLATGSAASPGTTTPPCDTVSTPWGIFCKNLLYKAKMAYGKDHQDLDPEKPTALYLTEGAPLRLKFSVGASYREDEKPQEPPLNNMIRVVLRSGTNLKYKDILMEKEGDPSQAVGNLDLPVGFGDELSFYYFENGSPKWLRDILSTPAPKSAGEPGFFVSSGFRAPVDLDRVGAVVEMESPYPADFYEGDPAKPYQNYSEGELGVFKSDPDHPLNHTFYLGSFHIGMKLSTPPGLPDISVH